MEKMSGFGTRLKELRLGRRMTQADLARHMKITQQAVGFWESGKTEPTMSMVGKLSRLFNVPVDDLIGLDSGKYEKLERRIARIEKWMAEVNLKTIRDR